MPEHETDAEKALAKKVAALYEKGDAQAANELINSTQRLQSALGKSPWAAMRENAELQPTTAPRGEARQGAREESDFNTTYGQGDEFLGSRLNQLVEDYREKKRRERGKRDGEEGKTE